MDATLTALERELAPRRVAWRTVHHLEQRARTSAARFEVAMERNPRAFAAGAFVLGLLAATRLGRRDGRDGVEFPDEQKGV